MNSNDVGERLHDRATRGEVLTAEEQVQLNGWYALRDRNEAAMLSQPSPPQGLKPLPLVPKLELGNEW